MADGTPQRAAVVGCRMGAQHARVLASLPAYELVALCDLKAEVAAEVAARTGDPQVFTDYEEMLATVRPDVVAVATPTGLHAGQVLAAVAAGVRGICCEKPLATNLADGRRMLAACEAAGVALIANHQRRMGADLAEARRLMEEGALGEPVVLRGNCAGDLISDGTHLIDSLLFLAGDEPVDWVLGQVHRQPGSPESDESGVSGYRYGHAVETGTFAIIGLRSGLRLELATGDMRPAARLYQDYEVAGTRGTLWRSGDRVGSNLFIRDAAGGDWVTGKDGWALKPVPAGEGERGEWRPVQVPEDSPAAMEAAYARFAETVSHGAPHPMCGENALRDLEVLMAVIESARLHRKLRLPLAQERYPLDLMMEAGAFG